MREGLDRDDEEDYEQDGRADSTETTKKITNRTKKDVAADAVLAEQEPAARTASFPLNDEYFPCLTVKLTGSGVDDKIESASQVVSLSQRAESLTWRTNTMDHLLRNLALVVAATLLGPATIAESLEREVQQARQRYRFDFLAAQPAVR